MEAISKSFDIYSRQSDFMLRCHMLNKTKQVRDDISQVSQPRDYSVWQCL